ncbi:hypothetical protein FB45DRAFT_801227 [Roridomyces roridus]|uniref:Stealth protein CR3 conserved region 3 domain-containing protein n=1 Tax=Roridomyces roridus TaxID=1738132 RepID=A0AAD7BCT4_9AGAR|nr:hypothetical protein FB45DRAFT_801227 [Roridomyces roridus]
MSSRSLPYHYQPLGQKSHSSLRGLIVHNPARWTVILLTTALSLMSIAYIVVQRPWGSDYDPTTQTNYWSSKPEAAPVQFGNAVYDPFFAPTPEEALASTTIRPIKAHAALSDECLDTWISTGEWRDPCHHDMVSDSVIDLIYVWVNGSDPIHQQVRKNLIAELKYSVKDARFRQHDELRYSLRAAANATKSWPTSTWHIITADVPDPEDDDGRLGLVPQWLDVTCAANSPPGGGPSIRLQHDAQLFRLTGKPGAALHASDARSWLERILPSFNSHAVESALPHLNPDTVSDNIVAFNDDQFLMLPAPPSMFHTTMYGSVFRVQWDLLVGADSSGKADGGGEWRSLGWSAHLLNQRFGERKRAYMQHNARSLSLPLLHELSLAFGEYFAATPLSHFRGSHRVPEEYEVNTIFLGAHYVVERHREALLWSWVVAKWGGASGKLSVEDKQGMWDELVGGGEDAQVEGDAAMLKFSGQAERTTAENIELNLLMAGVQPPRAFDKERQADTHYGWSSLDGYTPNFHELPKKTDIDRDQCLGRGAESAWSLFLRLLRGKPTCGDNVIAALVRSSKTGLSIFLPAPSSTEPSDPTDPITLPLILPSTAPPLPSNPRAFALRLIQRYAYVFGDTPTVFLGLRTASSAKIILANNDRKNKDTALVCLNDDLKNGDTGALDDALHEWFEGHWPEPLGCELSGR